MDENKKAEFLSKIEEMLKRVDKISENDFIPRKIPENFHRALNLTKDQIENNYFEQVDSKLEALESVLHATEITVQMKINMDTLDINKLYE